MFIDKNFSLRRLSLNIDAPQVKMPVRAVVDVVDPGTA